MGTQQAVGLAFVAGIWACVLGSYALEWARSRTRRQRNSQDQRTNQGENQ